MFIKYVHNKIPHIAAYESHKPIRFLVAVKCPFPHHLFES